MSEVLVFTFRLHQRQLGLGQLQLQLLHPVQGRGQGVGGGHGGQIGAARLLLVSALQLLHLAGELGGDLLVVSDDVLLDPQLGLHPVHLPLEHELQLVRLLGQQGLLLGALHQALLDNHDLLLEVGVHVLELVNLRPHGDLPGEQLLGQHVVLPLQPHVVCDQLFVLPLEPGDGVLGQSLLLLLLPPLLLVLGQLPDLDADHCLHQLLGVLLGPQLLGDIDPEVFHDPLEVLGQQLLLDHHEEGERHLEYRLRALEHEHVEDTEDEEEGELGGEEGEEPLGGEHVGLQPLLLEVVPQVGHALLQQPVQLVEPQLQLLKVFSETQHLFHYFQVSSPKSKPSQV